MYEDYYGLTEKPFSLTPDPKYLFKSESHAAAYERLQYAVRRREGFAVVTGDVGTGKTTLCRALLEEIDRNTFTSLVLNPFLSEEDLLKLILQDFGVVSREDVKRGRLARVSKQELIETIYDFLLSLLPLRAHAVLIVDEAQNLPMPVLEQIRILSNLETDKDKLLQIILVGQLNLQPLLKAPQMRQLDQRVSIRYELRPLTRDEVALYISHRLNVAGGSASVSFHPQALDAVHRLSGGIPRLVNLLCDRALAAASSACTNEVAAEFIHQAASALDASGLHAPRFAWMRRRASVVATAVGATASLAVAGGVVMPDVRGTTTHATVAASPFAGVSAAAPAPAPAPAPVSAPAPAPVVAPALAPAERIQPSPQLASLSSAPPSYVRGAAASPTAPPSMARRHTVLAISFPIANLSRPGSLSSTRLAEVVAQLESMGYAVRFRDMYLADTGGWRGVLVGAYSTLEEARAEAERLRQNPDFADAKASRY